MSTDDNSSGIKTQIDQRLIDEALQSVEQHTSGNAGAQAREAPVSAEEIARLQQQIAELTEREVAAQKAAQVEKERALRFAADMENAKKHAQKDLEDVRKYGLEKLAKDILPVIDNLERALEQNTDTVDALKTGVLMTKKLFLDTLARHQLESFSAVGSVFDPRLHEAMGTEPSAEQPANTVLRELAKGFTLNGRLLRPALVIISSGPTAPSANE